MIQKDKMTYAEYHEAVGHHDRRSEKIQRDEIERCIATLYKEADWSDCPKSVKKRKKRKRYTEEKKYDKVKKKR